MSQTSLKLLIVDGAIRVVFPLMGIVLLVSGLFGAITFGVQPLYEAMQTRQWHPVPATLEMARIEPADILHNRPLPAVKVRFHYRVGERDYVGTRYDLHQGVGFKRMVERMLAELGAGSAVTAWVNPNEVEQALMVRSLNWPVLAVALPFAGVALLGGILLLVGMVAWNQAGPLRRSGRRA